MKLDHSDYKTVTTCWVLSCQDKTAFMSYRGITERTQEDEKRVRELLNEFPELFQMNVPKQHLEWWKTWMYKKAKRPKWIARSKNPDELIENLSLEDVFRNRFRNSKDSEPTDIDILKWGLEYIKGNYSIKENKKEKFWNKMSSVVIPSLSIIVVILTMIFNHSVSNKKLTFENAKMRSELVSPIYNRFLSAFSNSLHISSDLETKIVELTNARNTLFEIAPFIESEKFQKIKIDFTDYHVELLSKHTTNGIDTTNMDFLITLYSEISSELLMAIEESYKGQ